MQTTHGVLTPCLKKKLHPRPRLNQSHWKLTPHARAAGLPKTRSGKIMRRVLRKIAAKADSELGDVSTLADPSVVQAIIAMRGK